jgi:calcineurin-like phosphoesterase family protein
MKSKARKESDMWFVSDMHFGHTNIIDFCNRPFAAVEEMDEALVANWNGCVGANDKVFHLGDWAFHNYERIGQLKGNIISVPGNHDHERAKKILPYLPNGFANEVEYLKIDKERRFVLCHYPFAAWRREYRYHLHGHMHGTLHKELFGTELRSNPYRLDVGVDATRKYRPLHLDEVMELLP